MAKKEFYLKVAEAILVEAGVKHVVYLDRHIRAYAARERRSHKRRYIVSPKPTTLGRVLTLAHEAAHVHFRHGTSLSSHRAEYEAENYSFATLMRYGIEFDEKKAIAEAQAYVASKIRMGRGTLKQICRESYRWAEKYLRHTPGGREVIARVASGDIKLVTLKRPDPSKAPRLRTRTLEITFYKPGKKWHGPKSTLSGLKGHTKRYTPTWAPDFTTRQKPPQHAPHKLPPHQSFTEILRNAIDKNGHSVYAIAKDSGIPQPVLARFYNGTRDNLRLDIADQLARYLGYTLKPTKP